MDGPTAEAGFRAWAATRRPGLRRTAYLLCLDWHTSDDVVQETLTKVFVRWPALVRSGNPDAYARKVVVTSVVDARRRPWRRERSADDVHLAARSAGVRLEDGTASHAFESVENTDLRTRITAALTTLPPRMRAAVVLRFYEDLSVQQTADVLGCSTGTVKSQTSRALHHLKKLLGPEFSIEDDAPDATGALTGGVP